MKRKQVIKSKYNIYEPLRVEGLFVVFSDNKAESIVKLEVSNKSLFIASTLLSGTNIDYNLSSIKPLSSLKIQNISYGMKLIIYGPTKNEYIYQLCTSENQMKVWGKFVSCLSTSPLKKLQYRTIEFSDKSIQTNAEKTSVDKENQNHVIQELSTATPTDKNNKNYVNNFNELKQPVVEEKSVR